MKKVTITLNDNVWKWWKKNPWINLSQLAERELKRLRALEERVLGTCPECGSETYIARCGCDVCPNPDCSWSDKNPQCAYRSDAP